MPGGSTAALSSISALDMLGEVLGALEMAFRPPPFNLGLCMHACRVCTVHTCTGMPLLEHVSGFETVSNCYTFATTPIHGFLCSRSARSVLLHAGSACRSTPCIHDVNRSKIGCLRASFCVSQDLTEIVCTLALMREHMRCGEGFDGQVWRCGGFVLLLSTRMSCAHASGRIRH